MANVDTHAVREAAEREHDDHHQEGDHQRGHDLPGNQQPGWGWGATYALEDPGFATIDNGDREGHEARRDDAHHHKSGDLKVRLRDYIAARQRDGLAT